MRRRALRVATWVAGGGLAPCVLLAITVRCGGGEVSAPGGPRPDASLDAAVRFDAQRDVNLPDVGAGWRALMPFGPECKYTAIAADPEAVMPPLVDVPCEGVPFHESTSCVEWDRSRFLGAQAGGLFNVFQGTEASRTMFAYTTEATNVRYEAHSAVYDVRARKPLWDLRYLRFSEAAGRRDDGCRINASVAGPVGPVLFANEPNFSFVVQALGDYPDKVDFKPLSPAFPRTQDVADDLTASDTVFAFHTLGPILRVNRADQTWSYTRTSGIDKPLVIDNDVLIRDRRLPYAARISRMEPNGDLTVVRAVPDVALTGVQVEGEHLYWLAQSGGTPPDVVPPHLEVWRSIYDGDISRFNARAERVAVYEGSPFGWYPLFFVRGGVAVVSDGVKVLAIRLQDGRAKTFTSADKVERVIPYLAEPDTLYFVFSYPIFGRTHLARVPFDW